ncbi:hypothetical protein FRC08_011764 [Ceratobasidium sp. 394]|nr:hypothetical protein FRC08_011764 [Ceratobasidium sp. 394]
MPSQLLNWLLAPLVNQPPLKPTVGSGSAPKLEISVFEPSPPASVKDEDDDAPPPFPLPNSIQRSGGTSSNSTNDTTANPSAGVATTTSRSRSRSPDSKRMPPPPVPSRLASLSTNGFAASPSSSTQQQPSRSTIALPSVGGLALPPSTTTPMPNVNKKGKARAKVALAPGHGALDWAKFKSSGADLRGVTELLRVTPSMLKEHRSRDDAWSAFSGKVYNITPYLAYHPGGERELMRVAGRDGTKLFATTHAWVNLDFMLDGCLVGFLVPE